MAGKPQMTRTNIQHVISEAVRGALPDGFTFRGRAYNSNYYWAIISIATPDTFDVDGYRRHNLIDSADCFRRRVGDYHFTIDRATGHWLARVAKIVIGNG